MSSKYIHCENQVWLVIPPGNTDSNSMVTSIILYFALHIEIVESRPPGPSHFEKILVFLFIHVPLENYEFQELWCVFWFTLGKKHVSA